MLWVGRRWGGGGAGVVSSKVFLTGRGVGGGALQSHLQSRNAEVETAVAEKTNSLMLLIIIRIVFSAGHQCDSYK